MNNLKTFLLFCTSLAFSIQSYSQTDCNQLPKTFQSYSEAISKIKSANFKIEQSLDASNSSWIRGAKFYSCDGISGYIIVTTNSKEYIHKDVPISIWGGFKNATSLGSYYDYNLKNRYHLELK
jgi:KTSC domain